MTQSRAAEPSREVAAGGAAHSPEPDDPRQQRQQLRDLVALLALPAMWRGQEPDDIANNLVDVVQSLLRADLVYLCVSDPAGGPPIEALRPRNYRADHDLSGLFARYQALVGSDAEAAGAASAVVGSMRLVRLGLSLRGGDGVLLAGTSRPDFPSDRERFLLRAAVDQAAIAIQGARLLRQERLARAEAEAAVRARDEFLSIASHELRNPIAGLAGAAQMLQRARARGSLDDTRLDRNLGIITETSGRLTTLLEDLLDVSRLQRGQLPLRRRPTDLAALVSAVIAREQLRTSAHQFVATVSAVGSLDLDPDRVEQVVVNVLDNAIKYSPDGGTIHIELSPSESGVVLRVRDPGIGLPAGTAERIFEPFGRAMNAADQRLPGLGLGLFICRQIVVQHGGRLWADSPGEGLGTIMTIWLPAVSQPDSQAATGA